VTTSNTSSPTPTTAPATRFRLDALAILVKGKDRYFEPAVEIAAVQWWYQPAPSGWYDSFTTPDVYVVAEINRRRTGSGPAWNALTPSPHTTAWSQNVT